jgi:hypothetical protein
MHKYINVILYNTINRILLLFNRCITAKTIFYIDNLADGWREWVSYKDYFEVNYNVVSKTDNKNYYKIEKQITLFKYKFKRK